MDPLSVAANAARVANIGRQLHQPLRKLVSVPPFYEFRKTISSVECRVSRLASILEELEIVIRRDYRVYRKQLLKVADKVLGGCEAIFKDIQGHVGLQAVDIELSSESREGVMWYFEGEGVKALQARLESLRSTFNVLLHVIQLAMVADAAQSYQYGLSKYGLSNYERPMLDVS